MNPSNPLEHYLAQVCTKISNIRVHESIHDELKDHILNIKDEYEEEGVAPEEALEIAFKKVGYANKVGQDLNKIHKDYAILFAWVLMISNFIGLVISAIGILIFHEWLEITFLLCSIMYIYLPLRFICTMKPEEVLFTKAFRFRPKRERSYIENLTNKIFIPIGIVYFGMLFLVVFVDFIASVQQGKIDIFIISSISVCINLLFYLLYTFRYSKIIVSTKGICAYGLNFIAWKKVARYEWSSLGSKYILKLFTSEGKIKRLELNITSIEQSILEGILLETLNQKSKVSD